MIDVLADYAEKLKKVGGRLYLSGLSKTAYDQVMRADTLELTGPVHAYGAEPIVWQSTSNAATDARTWLVGQNKDAPGDKGFNGE
jgi:SulP family sulfate permease